MARCGCGAGGCSCVVQAAAGSGMTVSGNGTAASPYSFSFTFTGWTLLTGSYGAGFSAYSGVDADSPAFRTFLGGRICQLRGRILTPAAPAVGLTILTGAQLGLRPGKNKWLPVCSNDAAGDNGQIEITPAGNFINQAVYPDGWISLDGIIYETAADV